MHSHLEEELSATWQSFPMELVREVLDHFIEDMLAPCHPGIEAFQSVTSKSTIDTSTDRLCEIGGPLRGEPLLKSQKRLIERHMHFTKNYLSQTTIYLFLDDPSSDYMDQYRMKDYCRYLRFPESTFNDIDMDPSTTIPLQVDLTPDEDSNLPVGSEKSHILPPWPHTRSVRRRLRPRRAWL